MKNIAVLLAGFGGPENAEEIPPFLESVVGGDPRLRLSPERPEQVLAQYRAVGNHSPYKSIVEKQRQALQNWFQKNKIPLRVATAFRHSRPFFEEAVENFQKEGMAKLVVFVLSPFRSEPSFEKYRDAVDTAVKKKGEGMATVYTAPFFDEKDFIGAQADRVKQMLVRVPSKKDAFFIFSAHSIPVTADRESGYSAQFEKSAALTAKALGIREWAIGYQSRSGRPQEAWLEPDVRGIVLKTENRFKDVVLAPIGFLCENAEIRFDLDVQARAVAETRGLGYFRAPTVDDHSQFMDLAARLILQAAKP